MPLRMLDLFAGCGGLTEGFVRAAAVEPVLAVEHDADAAETYALNFGAHVQATGIETVDRFPAAEIVVGGPPCQGFSTLNMARSKLSRRNLWWHYLRALDHSEPEIFVMENVPQLIRSPEYEAFYEGAAGLGYTVEARVLDAADFGVPQRRKRAIVIGRANGGVRWPVPTHEGPGESSLFALPTWRTFRDAVAGLPLVPDGHAWHRSRNPRPLSIERYRTIPREGEGRFELAARRPDITPRCWLEKPTGSTDVFGRLWWDRPSVTIRTEFFKPEKGRYLHPDQDRPITVREAARCMSFPDSFLFPEHQSMTSVARQVGNAVPPVLASAIAGAVLGVADEVADVITTPGG